MWRSLPGLLARPPLLLALAFAIAISFLAGPENFTRAWNEGRSALLAVVPLAILEVGRVGFQPLGERRSAVFCYAWLLVAAVYYFFAFPATADAIERFGVGLGVDRLLSHYSWLWGIDYGITSGLLIGVVMTFPRPRPLTPLLYTLGMSSFLFVDVVLPYNSLGPFQAVVPPILAMVAFLLNGVVPGSTSAAGNTLNLTTDAGSMNLQVFWPSAGLHGILICLMVVAFVSIKLEVGWVRGLFYLVAGTAGSFAVNVLRIVLLALYALRNITDPMGFEAFHSVVGDLVFIPWVVAYALFIVLRERRRHAAGLGGRAPQAPAS